MFIFLQVQVNHLYLFQHWKAFDNNNSNLLFLRSSVPPHPAGPLNKGLYLFLKSKEKVDGDDRSKIFIKISENIHNSINPRDRWKKMIEVKYS